jgi:hypothetical protein
MALALGLMGEAQEVAEAAGRLWFLAEQFPRWGESTE